ncbi:MAG: phosphoribosylaminoimidazolesuccinocarboxamide synthase, partial [Bacteriovorax sp.]
MNILPPLLYRGSVKNIRGEVSEDFLLFEFSDRYSVFDWGEMPDHLEGKGRALSVMGKAFFSYLADPKNWTDLFDKEIIRTRFTSSHLEKLHSSSLYKKLCLEGLLHHALLNDKFVEWNSPLLKVKKVSVLKPTMTASAYQYNSYQKRPVNTLVPLEIIFRMGLPFGNSLSKRLGDDLSKWKEFGFLEVPKTGELLKTPVIDFSTKLERGDRYLDYQEARSIAALNEAEWNELNELTQLIALNLFFLHHQMGLELWDGKIEMAFVEDTSGKRSFMLVDSIGIDELRLLYKGKSFSKEFLREFYKESQWYKDLEASKKESSVSGVDFKEICLKKFQSSPLKLDPNTKLRAEAVYKSYCNTLCEKLGT